MAGEAEPATLFHGGTILTMEDTAPSVEAIAVRNGLIVAAGTLDAATAAAGRGARRFDLQGRTLLPGFFDPHGHVSMVGLQARYANLLPAPDGEGDTIPALQRITRDWMQRHDALVRKTQLVIGFGYDDSQLKEQRHPTRAELDAISRDVPILFLHQSSHMGAVNTAALAAARITANTPDPDGGVYQREAGSREPNGVLEENALFAMMGVLFTRLDAQANREMLQEGAAFYASFGYTTCQDGRSSTDTCRLIESVAAQGGLPIDVLSFPDILTSTDAMALPIYRRNYVGRFRIGGVKLTIDGSPQAKTAWMSQPYYVPPAGRSAAYAGYPAITEKQAIDAVDLAFARGWQIEVHANGDAAVDLLIAAVREATRRHGQADRRPVLIHGQVTREDQVDQLKALGIVPSFFPMHTFYWGDWHRDSVLGPRRAENISPCGWALRRGMRFTSHHDAPVANPNAMRVLSATVTRRTRSGDILGADQRVPVDVALKAMTLWAAWQHFEDDRKGSLAPGKLADLTVLAENPLTIDPDRLANIAVTDTFKEARRVTRI
ncbi:amidohydrolase [Sphingomonas koreensis]|uniref:Amidohydrolase n=2 Tax=Sphingomonas koreensis TaxID=93064 RepID=A0A1L6JDI1_9SPHN|nr:amidohydrolase [Sphingomonas koreensis]RSU19046.1 amidohydrolase [Sphingomonas koreensis]RSU24122.1 amidohydrolase [Sphingomonas koreensis]RSU26372.1 amidohydrolase [Sphingomonas koreensis]RSU33961.1 amidohydrolase [Sphingomonas koreensis]